MIGLAVLALGVVAYFALGMPGMDHQGTGSDNGGEMDGMDMRIHALTPEAFAARLAEPDALVVNVHVPDEGMISGTDLSIPFDRIAGDARLEGMQDRTVLLYCKTGRMSQVAADALVDAGFDDVLQLEGGMDAWVATGRTLLPR